MLFLQDPCYCYPPIFVLVFLLVWDHVNIAIKLRIVSEQSPAFKEEFS
jgi:hypothetical protein